MSDILLVRPAQTLPSPSAPDFLEKLKTLLDLREGHTKDQGSRFVTLNQLISMGLVPKGYGPNNTYTGGATSGGSDVTPPSPPTNLQIINNFGSHTISWENPGDKDLSHVEVWRSNTQDRGLAELVSIATNPVATVSLVGVMPNQDYYYWIRAVDTSGNYSVWTPNNQQGGELVAADIQGAIDDLKSKLQGQITETELYGTLNTRIDKIESMETQMALLQAASSQDVQEMLTALQDEQTARISGDAAEATARQGLATQVRGSYTGTDVAQVTTGLIYSERQARTTADSALASQISTLTASLNNTNAAIVTEQTTRASADTAIASSVTTLQTTVESNTASIQQHTSTINGLSAQWYLKTDVNGYVSGFGMANDGATSSFIINADKFAVVKPGSPAGATSKIPFVVGTVNGASTVGIDGQLVVDGTILARSIAASAVTANKIAAGAVTANKVAANAINGDHIQAQSSIKLNEGGKLTVGNNNIVLDSTDDQIVVAPDNGTIIGAPEYDGVDYCRLKDGNVNFMYWDGTKHVLYNSLKRVEMGMSRPNNVRVTIPGIWKEQPKIIVSPADIMTYNKNYNADQNLVCAAEDIRQDGLTYSFTPRAYLRLTNGSTGLAINLTAVAASNSFTDESWHYANTATRTTPLNTTTLKLTGSLAGGAWRKYYVNGGYYDRDDFYVRVWVYVDGVEYYWGEWHGKGDGLLATAFTKTISGLQSGAHNYYAKIAYRHDKLVWTGTTYDKVLHGQIVIDNETTNQSTFTSLANGTLNYMAVGE